MPSASTCSLIRPEAALDRTEAITLQRKSLDELSDSELMAIAAGVEDEGGPVSEATH
jgi:hypothetical protein